MKKEMNSKTRIGRINSLPLLRGMFISPDRIASALTNRERELQTKNIRKKNSIYA